MATFKIYSPNNSQTYNTVSLTIGTMLYTLSLQDLYFYNWKSVSFGHLLCLATISLFPLSINMSFGFLLFVSFLLDPTYKLNYTVFVFLHLTYFTLHNAFMVHPYGHKMASFPFYG